MPEQAAERPFATRPSRASRLRLACGVAVAAGAFGALALPWFVPVAPSASVSYDVGFNNRVAILAVAAMAAALAAISWRMTRPRPSSLPLFLTRLTAEDRIPRSRLAVALAVVALSSAVLGVVTYGDHGYGEMAYTLDRMAAVIAGFEPYRAFEYPYGPVMLYLPVWAHRVLGVTPQAGYLVTLTAWNLAGIGLLYYVVGRLGLGRAGKTALFVGLAAYLAVNESMGMNVSYTRALLPVATLLFVHERHRAGRGGAVALLAWASAAVVLNAAVSPELGVASAAALVAYLGAVAWRSRGAYAAALIAFAGVLAALASAASGATGTLLAFAGGSGDFPVLPGPPVLVYLFGVTVAAVATPALVRARPAEAPVTLGVASAAVVMTPAVLSRADAGHVLLNSLAVVVLCCLALRERPRALGAYVGMLAGVFLISHALLFAASYKAPLQRDLAAVRSGRRAATDVSSLAAHRPVAAPYLLLDAAGFDLAARGWFAPTHYILRVCDDAQLRRQLASLERANALLVPAGALEYDLRRASGQAVDLRALTMWPGLLRPRNEPQPLARRFASYVAEHYAQAGTVGPYSLYVRETRPAP